MKKRPENVVVGSFANAADARRAIHSLRNAHFDADDIGVVVHDHEGDPELLSFKEMAGHKAGKGAAIGAAAGAGGGLLWAAGIAAGVLPAIGPVIAGGLLAAVVASGAAGAAGGSLVGALVGLGLTDEEAAYYDEEFRQGRTIVVVDPGDREELAFDILRANQSVIRHGASTSQPSA